jgi:predicted negative regulator of RcsB-dependent stress response
MINKDMIFGYAKDISKDKSTLTTAIIVFIGVLAISGYFLHGWYSARVQSSAQLAFSESLDVFNQSLMKDLTAVEKKDNDWDESDLAFKTAYDHNKHAKISPFYLVYQAQSLAREGDVERAVEHLDRAISDFSRDVHFLNLFKITKNLILFNGSLEQKQNALDQMKALSDDKDNPLRDMALYYLGEYYYAENDIVSAKDAFQRGLELEFKNELGIESPWVNLCKEKIALL